MIIVRPVAPLATVTQASTRASIRGVGAQGPPGPSGAPGGARFVYTQSTPAATWIITHNLGTPVGCALVNSAGTIVDADIVLTSSNVTTVMFSTPQVGSAIIS